MKKVIQKELVLRQILATKHDSNINSINLADPPETKPWSGHSKFCKVKH